MASCWRLERSVVLAHEVDEDGVGPQPSRTGDAIFAAAISLRSSIIFAITSSIMSIAVFARRSGRPGIEPRP